MDVVKEEGAESNSPSDSFQDGGRDDATSQDSGLFVAYADDEFVARGQAQARAAVDFAEVAVDGDSEVILAKV